MKNGLVISDAGPIFSLAVVDELQILNELFDEVRIPNAVWEEITLNKTIDFFPRIEKFFKSKVSRISGFNDLTFIMDYGESESVILFRELKASFLLIDDKKARSIAENLDIQCIGTLGLLSIARTKGIIQELHPIFKSFIKNNRYYSIKLLNSLLERHNEQRLNLKHGKRRLK